MSYSHTIDNHVDSGGSRRLEPEHPLIRLQDDSKDRKKRLMTKRGDSPFFSPGVEPYRSITQMRKRSPNWIDRKIFINFSRFLYPAYPENLLSSNNVLRPLYR
ncbi:hypothetical protein CDAR_191811 [Caerostris darwini]|uniref:Ycf15 n=1 Tax=Caerostris darwini TaxID=1538125 RepID=A0AAV4P8G5_9ARAC|nr:hypothetical protein CDAR_191811 [Caerostris darwini]